MRTLLLVTALLLAPAALSAQTWPEGWQVRPDRAGVDVSEIAFTEMAPGHHVTTGPAAIIWRADDQAGGRYRVDFEAYLFDPEGRREAFGVFFGGRDLTGDAQRYTYFLIRDGGEFLVKERNGRETSTLVEWTAHPAIRSFADRGEGEVTILNHLAVEADDDEVRFYVNDAEVTSITRRPGAMEGIAGLRVNHSLNLHVSRVAVSPLGAGAPARRLVR
jgi:hypothetical protein